MSTSQESLFDTEALRFLHFFNGRLLTAEDFQQEQTANRQARQRLGIAIGTGVVEGLGVSKSKTDTVRIAAGRAITLAGQALSTKSPLEFAFAAPSSAGAKGKVGFFPCEPSQKTVYAGWDGVYLLSVAQASKPDGIAPASGLAMTASTCQVRYEMEGAQFRITRIPNPPAIASLDLLRNTLAYRCYGTEDLKANPFTAVPVYGLLDTTFNSLKQTDVPLALIQWTESGGIGFVDMWSVRRRVYARGNAEAWDMQLGDRRLADAEARFFQFQEQIEGTSHSPQFEASTKFAWLPPAGYLKNDFTWKTFFGDRVRGEPKKIDGGLLRELLHRSLFEEPIDLKRTPPVPVELWQVPEEAGFVLFTRLVQGRIVVDVTPASAAAQITVESKTTGERTRAVDGAADVPPGTYIVTAAASGYELEQAKEAPSIAGRSTEPVELKLVEPKPTTGSMLVNAFDKDGKLVNSRMREVLLWRSSVKKPVPAGELIHAVYDPKRGWFADTLAPGEYSISISSASYETWLAERKPVRAGEQTSIDAVLTLRATKPTGVPQCAEVQGGSMFLNHTLRVCMIHKLATREPEFPYWRDWPKLEEPHPKPGEWVQKWKEKLDLTYKQEGIGGDPVEIYVNPKYTVPRDAKEIPEDPQAWAVIGNVNVPMLVMPAEYAESSIKFSNQFVPGVEDFRTNLYAYGIHDMTQLSAAWTGLVDAATGKGKTYSRSLIGQSAKARDKARQTNAKYSGMTKEMAADMREMGFDSDAAIANADAAVIEGIVKKYVDADMAGDLAIRLIEQARQFAGDKAWNLSYLGFNDTQVGQLKEEGIDSIRRYAEDMQSEERRNAVARIITVPQADETQKMAFLSSARESAVSKLTEVSILSKFRDPAYAMQGMTESTRSALAGRSYTREKLAVTKAADLAAETGIPEALAETLVKEAAAGSRGSTPVSSVALVDQTQAAALKESGFATMGDVAAVNLDTDREKLRQISAIFGNDELKARAFVSGAQQALRAG